MCKIIRHDTVDHLVEDAYNSVRLRKNICLHESIDSPAQIMINSMHPGTIIDIHRHFNTNEFLFLMQGSSLLYYYNDDGEITESFILSNNENIGVLIPKGQWHWLDVVESSVFIEIKEGPYRPLLREEVMCLPQV